MRKVESMACWFVCFGITYLIFAVFQSWSWVSIIGLLFGYLAADFVSGVVHWLADRYGNPATPFFGSHFITPFREHHKVPSAIIGNDFVTINGNVAILLMPIIFILLLTFGLLPTILSTTAVGFAVGSMLTNQIHKWAHSDSPPKIIKLLQSIGVVISKGQHNIHHISPYDTYYFITVGWLNGPFHAFNVFGKMEKILKRLGVSSSVCAVSAKTNQITEHQYG